MKMRHSAGVYCFSVLLVATLLQTVQGGEATDILPPNSFPSKPGNITPPKPGVVGVGGQLGAIKVTVISPVEVMQLGMAASDIKALVTGAPQPFEKIETGNLDPEIVNPSVYVPEVLAQIEQANARLESFRKEHRFVERLLPFSEVISAQKMRLQSVRGTLASGAHSGIGGSAQPAHAIGVVDAVNRLVSPHRYLVNSFHKGAPEPEGVFACCWWELKKDVTVVDIVKAAASGVMPGEKRCDVPVGILPGKKCAAAHTKFAWEVALKDAKVWISSMPVTLDKYEAALLPLAESVVEALSRFNSSAAMFDTALGTQIEAAEMVLQAHMSHLSKAESKLQGMEDALQESKEKLATAEAALVAAESKANSARQATEAVQKQLNADWAAVDIAEAKSEQSAKKEAALRPPFILSCGGEWRPNCSSDPLIQRSADAAQQKYFDALLMLGAASAQDRIALVQALIKTTESNAKLLQANFEASIAYTEESSRRREFSDWVLRVDAEQAAVDRYRVLVEKARSEGEDLSGAIHGIAAHQKAIRGRGGDKTYTDI